MTAIIGLLFIAASVALHHYLRPPKIGRVSSDYLANIARIRGQQGDDIKKLASLQRRFDSWLLGGLK